MSSTPLVDLEPTLDDLCQRRAEAYPVRDAVYRELARKLKVYCRRLQARQSDSWRPDSSCVAHAETLRPLFIRGFPKSGTTFILNLLDGHPAISALPGDAKLLRSADQLADLSRPEAAQRLRERWIQSLVTPTGLPPFWVFGRGHEPYREFLDYLDYWLDRTDHPRRRLMHPVAYAYFCANPRRSPQTRFWAEKTPALTLDVPEVLELYPNARFVQILRNPLASIAALKSMTEARGRRFGTYHLISNAQYLRQYFRDVKVYLKRLEPLRYVVLRYEDILADPVAAMSAMADRLGIPYHKALVTPTVNGRSSTPNSAYAKNRLRGRVQTESLEKWRERLSRPAVAQVVDILGEEAEALGYDWSDLQPASSERARTRAARTPYTTLLIPLFRTLSGVFSRTARQRFLQSMASFTAGEES